MTYNVIKDFIFIISMFFLVTVLVIFLITIINGEQANLKYNDCLNFGIDKKICYCTYYNVEICDFIKQRELEND